MGITTAEIISIVIALIEHAPEFIKFVQNLKAQGLPLVRVPGEHAAAVSKALAAINSKRSANVLIEAVAERMR